VDKLLRFGTLLACLGFAAPVRTSLYRKQLTQRFAAWRRLIDFIQNPSTVRANTCFLSFHAVDNQPGNAAATVR
jgi:hypothetical protein